MGPKGRRFGPTFHTDPKCDRRRVKRVELGALPTELRFEVVMKNVDNLW